MVNTILLCGCLDPVVWYWVYYLNGYEVKMNYTVKKLASMANVNPETVRFYEKQGLLPEPRRGSNGYRLYDDKTLHQLKYIVNAKSLGFTLDETEELLQLNKAQQKMGFYAARKLTKNKIADLKRRITQLEKMVVVLESLHETCQKHATDDYCPIIDAFNPHSDKECQTKHDGND